MEGLEISEVTLSEVLKDNKTKRIDSEYFKKQFLNFFDNVSHLRSLGDFVEDGYRVVYENTKVINEQIARENYFPVFLQATDINSPFIEKTNLHYVNESEWIRYPKGRIKKGEILIEVKGKIEKVGIVPDDFPEKTLVSGSLYKMTINEKISKYVLLCYIISKYGVAFKDRYKTNLLISFVSKSDLYRIPVPDFSIEFQNRIDETFARIIDCQEQTKTLYAEAENILLKELGLDGDVADMSCHEVSACGYKSSSPCVVIKSFSDFANSGRLDAEYYQPKYDKIETVIQSYKGGSDVVSSFFTQNKTACTFDKQVYKYIEIGDINIGNGEVNYSLIPTEKLPANAKIIVNKGDLLVSKVRPYRGAVAIVDFAEKDIIASGAFTVLQEKQGMKKEVLQVLLRTSFYKDWLLKWNVGSSYPVIKDDDILNLRIPKISENIQHQIADKVQESFTLKAESKRLLNLAKTAVETAIEQGESAAMELLN